MSSIRFSVVITCHNQRDFIRAAVDSALLQGHPLKEIIVVDDASSDGSLDLLQQYGTSIRLIKFSSNRGAIEARNEGARLARGQYLVFLDGDDVLRRWALDVYERIVVDRNAKIIAARALWFRGEVPVKEDAQTPVKVEVVEYEGFLSKDRPYGMSASTWILERQAFEDVGGWTLGIFHLDSVDLALKLREASPVVLVCSPSTVFYRVHASNSIHSVPPFIDMLHRLMRKERSGEYPGGAEHQFERRAFLGGLVFFWIKRGIRAGCYKKALGLFASGIFMVAGGVTSRVSARMKGLRPVRSISMSDAIVVPHEQEIRSGLTSVGSK